ncbi:Odorant receptor 106 [Blattella germanica]|nr:Odorant receptor 106 [Blattella germanica]
MSIFSCDGFKRLVFNSVTPNPCLDWASGRKSLMNKCTELIKHDLLNQYSSCLSVMVELLKLQRSILGGVCFLGSKGKWYIYLGVSCWLLVLMAQLYGVHKFWGNIDAMAEGIGVILMLGLLIVQAAHCLKHSDQLQHIIDFLENLFNQFENEECREIVLRTQALTNKVIKSLVPIFVTDVSFWIFPPFIRYYFDEDKHGRPRADNEPFPYFCFIMDFPFDATHSPIFEVVFLVQLTCTTVLALFDIALLTIVFSTILFTAAYLKALATMLRKLVDFEPGDKEIEDPEAYLNNCIRLHQQLLSFSVDLQQYLSPILIFFLKPFELFLCIAVYEAVQMTDKVSTFVVSAIALLSGISVLCAFGEHLKEQSELLEKEVTACRWYLHSTRFKRHHLLLLAQCQRTIRLKVGFFYPLTLETFIKILNTTYAYFNLLQQLR